MFPWLVPAGVRKQASNHVGDRCADTQRDEKHSEKFQCRHGGLSPTRATHIAPFYVEGCGANTPDTMFRD